MYEKLRNLTAASVYTRIGNEALTTFIIIIIVMHSKHFKKN